MDPIEMLRITQEKARELMMNAIKNLALTASFVIDDMIEKAANDGYSHVFVPRSKIGVDDSSERSIALSRELVSIYEDRGFVVSRDRHSISFAWN